jgi:ZIP family zinc transporter
VLASYPKAVSGLLLAAAGGILYLVFHDIVPEALREGHHLPTLGGVIGFLAGMVGHMVVGGSLDRLAGRSR